MDEDRLFQLLEDYVEGRLSAEDQSALEEFLSAHPEARIRFWDYVHQHALLRQLTLQTEGKALAAQTLHPRRRIWTAAAAVLLLAGSGAVLWKFLGEDPVATAVVELVDGGAFRLKEQERIGVAAGESLFLKEGIETGPKARALLRFEDGTRLELGPATTLRNLRLEGGKQIQLAEGTLRAKVAKQPVGMPMRIQSPDAEATVLGTTLKLAVDPDRRKGTRLEVEEGKVRLSTLAGKAVDVPSGHYAVAILGSDPVSKPNVPPGLASVAALVETMPPNSWLSLPNTSMWGVVPDRAKYPKIQGTSGPQQVIACWSGGALDTRRHQLLVWGGGSTMYSGNELYAFSLESLSWNRLTDPCPDPSDGGQTNSDGTPNARATYNGLAYIAHADRFFALGGDPATSRGGGGPRLDILWTFDVAARRWSSRAPSGTRPPTHLGNNCAYDPGSRKLWWGEVPPDGMGLYSYDYDANSWTRHNSDPFYYQTSAIDTRRGLMVNVGGGREFAYDLRNPNPVRQDWATRGGEALIRAPNPGLDYDAGADRIVGWTGGSVLSLDPDTKVWTGIPAANAPAPTENGIFGRWRYVPDLGVFVVVTSINENVHLFKFARP
jgi:ferric-dicitrate binding protein FerR (iron transport regulator)